MNIQELKRLAEQATPGPWMHLFGDRHVYDRMNDGCRGNPIVGVEYGAQGIRANDLDYVAAANPAAALELIRQRDELLEACKRALRCKYYGDEEEILREAIAKAEQND